MDFGKFIRECYLRSNPSVDLDKVMASDPINCSAHKLSVSEYEKILEEFHVKENYDLLVACNMWCLQSGPSLFEG